VEKDPSAIESFKEYDVAEFNAGHLEKLF